MIEWSTWVDYTLQHTASIPAHTYTHTHTLHLDTFILIRYRELDLLWRPDPKSIEKPDFRHCGYNLMAALNFANQNTTVICHTL